MKLRATIALFLLLAAGAAGAEGEPSASVSYTSKWVIFTAGGIFAWMLFAPLRRTP